MTEKQEQFEPVCPQCGGDEFSIVSTRDGTIDYDEYAEDWSDLANAEVEEETGQTIVKCKNCNNVLYDWTEEY